MTIPLGRQRVRTRLRGQTPPAAPDPGVPDRKVTLKLGTEVLTLPLTSPRVEHDDIAPDWVQIERPEQTPLLRKANGRLWRMQFDCQFRNNGRPVEGGLRLLERFSNHGFPVVVGYGPLEAGAWQLVGVRIRSERRQKGTNAIVRADVSLTFLRVIAPAKPPPSAVAPKPPPPPKSSGTSAAAPAARVHVVRKGETLSKIAAKYYGDANRFHEIAKANKISDPNRIFPGQRLRIP
jgi:LysM repeat protein